MQVATSNTQVDALEHKAPIQPGRLQVVREGKLAQLRKTSVLDELRRDLAEATAVALVPALIEQHRRASPWPRYCSRGTRVGRHVVRSERDSGVTQLGVLRL